MKNAITLQEKLRDLREERKLKLTDVSEATGIPASTLQRIENTDDMRVGYQDVAVLGKFYNVSMDYLFAVTSNRQHRNIEVDKLHLSDEAIEVLSSGNINNRLINEFISHPDFPQLLSSMEMYIDRKITPQMGIVNGIYKLTEDTIREKFTVADSDKTIAFLQDAIVSEDEYLRYRISERFNDFMKNMFDKHKKDVLTVEQENVLNEMKEDIKLYYDNNSEPTRGRLAIFCKKLGLNISKLSDEELRILINTLQNSELYKKTIKARKIS